MPGADRYQSSRSVALETVIEAHLEKVLSSGVFKTADRLRELLRFTVNETLAGRGGDLKEYVLGMAVLQRGDSFDPKADPVVRMQMRRLRDYLHRYYATEGRYDPIVIDIPKGTYVPTFGPSRRDGAVAAAAATNERLIVGRHKELTELRASFASAAGGRGQLFCLTGEPGIGKTTVVETFLLELETSAAGCYVARGRCSERLAGREAYLPVLEALESLVRGGDESVGRLMIAVAPTWYLQIAPATDDYSVHAAGKVTSQERLKRELIAFIEELARRQPVVLFLDDLQWADASTVDILAYAAARCISLRILIVGTYRLTDVLAADHPFLHAKLELQGHGICREIAMCFLTCADVDRYLGLHFPEHHFPAELPARIHNRTEGNPLFMADLVRFMRDHDMLAERDGRWVMVGQLEDVDRELPESVRAMVEKKIGQLSDDERRLLVAASVQGYEFDAAVVSTALALDAAQVEERLEVLERVRGFVRLMSQRELPDRTLTLRYRFVHVLYQNALHATLQPARKASLSAAVAKALIGYFGPKRSAIASELAILFEAARDFERAAEYFRLGAEHAARLCASKEAVVLARRGLDALRQLPESSQRAEHELRLQTTLGPALMIAAGYGTAEVEAVYTRARELCEQVGETPQLFPVIWGLSQHFRARADYRSARELGEHLLGLAQKVHDPALLLMAHHSLANTFAFSGDFEACRTHGEQARAIYVPEQHQSLASLYGGYDPGITSQSGLAGILWRLGYPDQALHRGEEALALARKLRHTDSLALALAFDAMVHQWRRDVQRTREQAEAALAVAEQPGPWLVFGTVLRGWALAQQGQGEEGITLVSHGIAVWKTQGTGCLQPYFLTLLADAYAGLGREEEALRTLAEALAITEQTHEGYAHAELYRLTGELQTDSAEAEASFHQAIEIARRQRAKSFELRAAMSLSRLYEREGKPAAARQMLAEIHGWFTEGFDTADLKEAAALLERVGGSRSEPSREVSSDASSAPTS